MEHVTTTFRLPEELYEKIRLEAFNKKASLGEIVRRACIEYIENHELKVQGEIDGPNSENNRRRSTTYNIPSES